MSSGPSILCTSETPEKSSGGVWLKKYQSRTTGSTEEGTTSTWFSFFDKLFWKGSPCFSPSHHNLSLLHLQRIDSLSMVTLGFSFYISVYQHSEKFYIPHPRAMWKQEALPCIRGLGSDCLKFFLKTIVTWLFAPSEDPLKLLIQENWDYLSSALGSDTQAQMHFPIRSNSKTTQQKQLQIWSCSLKESKVWHCRHCLGLSKPKTKY